MTASAVLILILAIAVVTGLSGVSTAPASAGLPSTTAVFSETIRTTVPLNVSTLVLLQEETEAFAVAFSPVPVPAVTPVPTTNATPVATPVATPTALKEEKKEEETFAIKNATATTATATIATTTSSTTGGPPNYYENLLQEGFKFASSLWQDTSPRLQGGVKFASNLWQVASPCLQDGYDFASSLWQDASHVIAYSSKKVIQVSKVSLYIFSTRFTVKAKVVFSLPEITRILSKQCSLISPSQPTCNVDAMDVLTSKAMIFSKQCSLTSLSQPTCNVDAMDVLTSKAMIYSKQCSLTPPSWPTCSVDAMDVLTSKAMISSKQCSLTPPSKTTCSVDDKPRGLVFLSVFECVWMFSIVLIFAVVARRIIKSRIYRFLRLAAEFANRAIKYNPRQRVEMEVRDLCPCILTSAFNQQVTWMQFEGELTHNVEERMIKKVCKARHEANRTGQCHEPTMIESLCACYTEVSSFLKAEVHHTLHASHDEKLERELDQMCLCMLKTEYAIVTGNEVDGKSAPIPREAIFKVRKSR